MKIREDEVKYLLGGPEDLRRLTGPGGLGPPESALRQEDRFLDTPALLLARSGAVLRLRAVAGSPVLLTLKIGGEVEAGFFRSVEISDPLPDRRAAEVLGNPDSIFRMDLDVARELQARHGEPHLEIVGRLVTERSRHRSGSLRIDLDRLTYPDGSREYEVEMETSDPEAARARLLEEFRRLGVRAEPARETKLERLLRKVRGPL